MSPRAKHLLTALLALHAALVLAAVWHWIPPAREPGYRHLATWGEVEGPGRLEGPIGIAIMGDEVFVSDSIAHRIVVYDREGRFLRAFGEYGAGRGQLDRPMHLAACEGKVFVAEYLNDRIQVFARRGESLATVGSSGSGPGQFDAPAGVAVDEDGRLYVADFFSHRVQLLEADGSFVMQFGDTGKKGIRPGRFNYPTDVELLPWGDLLVADAYNDRIQRFAGEGDSPRRWGGPFALRLAGPFRGWFRVATGLGVAPDGAIFVADFFNHRIQKFDPAGTFRVTFGQEGHGPGQFDRPTDVAVADDGTVYVADFGNGRVQVFLAEEGYE